MTDTITRIQPDQKFELSKLVIDKTPGSVEATCKVDDRYIVKWAFPVDGIEGELSHDFSKTLAALQKGVMTTIEPFKHNEGFPLKEIKKDTRGKGDDKHPVFIFKAVDKDDRKIQMTSGEIREDGLKGGISRNLGDIEEHLLKVANLYHDQLEENEQQGLFNDVETDEAA